MDFMNDIAPQLELSDAFLEEWDAFLENNAEHIRFRLESRCPEYRHASQARGKLEDDIFADNTELKNKHLRYQVETDNALIKSAFLLGIKTGIKLNQT